MSKLVFDKTGTRFFETGISDVVLYVYDSTNKKYGKGVAWNGVSALNESPEGGDDNFVYADNIKYLNLKSLEEWNGSITAYSSPEEFDACDGSATLGTNSGIKIGEQTRKTFALVFKTRIGNDVDGDKLGYKLIVVYGLTCKPSSRDHQTVNDSPEAQELSWDLSSLPIKIDGYEATSRVEVDSTKVSATKLKTILDKLYGTDGTYTTFTGSSFDTGTTYYEKNSDGEYVVTTDSTPQSGKTYYTQTTAGTDPTLMMPIDFKELAESAS